MSQIANLAPTGTAPAGDVVGPSSSTDGAIALFDGTTGKLIKESLTIQVCGTVQTTDDTPTNLLTIALDATDAAYVFDVKITAYNETDTLGAGYKIDGSIRTDGTDSTLCSVPDKITNEEVGMSASMVDCDANAVAGGVADNNLYIQVTGIAAKTINWAGCISYIKINTLS